VQGFVKALKRGCLGARARAAPIAEVEHSAADQNSAQAKDPPPSHKPLVCSNPCANGFLLIGTMGFARSIIAVLGRNEPGRRRAARALSLPICFGTRCADCARWLDGPIGLRRSSAKLSTQGLIGGSRFYDCRRALLATGQESPHSLGPPTEGHAG